MNEKVAIVGSRGWADHETVKRYVYSLDPDDIVVSGGAVGVDQYAEIYADERGLATLIFYPNYQEHGPKRAPIIRNGEIAAACNRLVAFWDGLSSGTYDAICQAEAAGKDVLIFRPPECIE